MSTNQKGRKNAMLEDLAKIAMKESCFVSGGRGSGKSRLGMLLTQILLQNDIQVKVIDSSRTWLKHSSIPHYYTVKQPITSTWFHYWNIPNLWNCIYDCSRLSTFQLRAFTSGMMEQDFSEAVELDEMGNTPKAVYILEEVQNLVPNGSLRNLKYQEISRFVTQGRNFGLAYIGITQRLASVDTTLVEISGLKFFGKIEGDNNTRKAKAWLPNGMVKQTVDFKAGTFLMQYGSKATVEQVPLFTSPVKPKRYIEPKPQKKPSLIERIFGLKGDAKA